MLKYIFPSFQFLLKSNFSAEAVGGAAEASKDPLQNIEDIITSLESSPDGDVLAALEEINNQRDAAVEYIQAHTQSDASKLLDIMSESFGESLGKGMEIQNERDFAAFQAALKTVNADFSLNVEYAQLVQVIRSSAATLTYNAEKNVVGVYTDVQDNVLDELAAVISSNGTVHVYDGTNDGWNNPLNDNEFDSSEIKETIDDMQEGIKTADAEDNVVSVSAAPRTSAAEVIKPSVTEFGVEKIVAKLRKNPSLENLKLAYARLINEETKNDIPDGYDLNFKFSYEMPDGLQTEGEKITLEGKNGELAYFTITHEKNASLLQSDVALRDWIKKKIQKWEGGEANTETQKTYSQRYFSKLSQIDQGLVTEYFGEINGSPELKEKIQSIQQDMIEKGITGLDNQPLDPDGILGANTLHALKRYDATPSSLDETVALSEISEEPVDPQIPNVPTSPVDNTERSYEEIASLTEKVNGFIDDPEIQALIGDYTLGLIGGEVMLKGKEGNNTVESNLNINDASWMEDGYSKEFFTNWLKTQLKNHDLYIATLDSLSDDAKAIRTYMEFVAEDDESGNIVFETDTHTLNITNIAGKEDLSGYFCVDDKGLLIGLKGRKVEHMTYADINMKIGNAASRSEAFRDLIIRDIIEKYKKTLDS